MKTMELRAKGQLPLRLNEKEFVITQKKRKRENVSSRQASLSFKKCKDNRKVDTFCWVCHKRGKGKVCSECPRIYHNQCLKGLKSFTNKNICPECQLESVGGQDQMDPCKKLKELLMYAMDKTFSLKNIKDIFFNWPENDSNHQLYNKLDAEILCEKLKADSYKSPIEFFSDFKWILHNSSIVYGDKSDFTHCASQLVKKLKEELLKLEACSDCYFFQNSKDVDEADFFYKICSKPHDVIFAKVKGFSFWPAKCLKVMKNGTAYVAFFGTHEMSCIPANMWFPLKGKSEKLSAQQLQYSVAITELLGYCENLQTLSSETVKECTKSKCEKEIQTSLSLPEQEILPDILTSFSAFNTLFNDEVDCKPFITDMASFSTNEPEQVSEPSDSINRVTISEPVSVSMTFSEDSLCFNETEIEELLSFSSPSIESQKHCKSGKLFDESVYEASSKPFTDCCSSARMQSNSNLNEVSILCNTVQETILNNFSPGVSDKEPLLTSVNQNDTFEKTTTFEDRDNKADAKEYETIINRGVNEKTQIAASLEPQINLFLQENSKKIVDTVVVKLLDTLYQTLPSIMYKMKKKHKSDKTLEKNKLSDE